MEVEAKVLDVNPTARRISISIKEVAPINPEPKDEEEAAPVEEVKEEAPAAVEAAPVAEEAAPAEE